MQGALDIECERDWPVGFVATLGGREKIKKTLFTVSGVFPGKAESVILFGFESSINPQNLIKIAGAIFEKIKIIIFFSCELPLIFRVDRKRKNELEIFARGPQISNLNEIGQLI